MKYVEKNKILVRLLCLYSFIILGFIFNNNITFAAFGEDTDINKDILPVGVQSVSRYEGGFKEIQNQFIDSLNQNSSDVIRYYFAANVYEKAINDSLKNSANVYTVYLYSLTNNKFDEEIADAMKKRKEYIESGNYSQLKTIPGFFDGETMTYFPDGEVTYTFENLMMWPVSSNGDYYIKDLYTTSAQNKVKAHNMHDFTHVSKDTNFWLGSLIPANNTNYGVSYVNAGFDLSVEYPTTEKSKEILKTISKKFYGVDSKFINVSNYFNRNYAVNKNGTYYNGNYFSVAQDYFKHITLRFNYETKQRIPFETAKANSVAMHNTTPGFENQSYMFLTDSNGTKNLARMYWSVGLYGAGVSELSSFPRSQNATVNGTFNEYSNTFVEIYNASTSTLKNANYNAWLKSGKLEGLNPYVNDLVFKSLGNSFENLHLYHKVPANAVSSVYDLMATYDGLYNYVAGKALIDNSFRNYSKDASNIDYVKKVYNLLNKYSTAGEFAKLANSYTKETDEAKKAVILNEINSILKVLTIYTSRYFIMDTPSTVAFGTTTLYAKTSAGGYRSFVSSKITVTLPETSEAVISSKDIYLAENGTGYNHFVIVDLKKALSIPEDAYSKFISNWMEKAKTLTNKSATNKNKTSSQIFAMIDYVGDDIDYFKQTGNKRKGVLLGKAMKGENIGIYLNDSEIWDGKVIINEDKIGFENLNANTPYVIISTVRQRTGVYYSETPKILSKTYDNMIEEGASLSSKTQAEKDSYYESVKKYFKDNIVFLFNEQVDAFETDIRMQFVMITNSTEGYSSGPFTDKISWYTLDEEVQNKNSNFYKLISDTKIRSNYYNEILLNKYIKYDNFQLNLTPKYSAVANGKRVYGLTPTTYNSDNTVSGYQYYEMSEVSPSGSSKTALNRMIVQNSSGNNINLVYNIDKYQSSKFVKFDGDLYTVNGTFSNNIFDLLGYTRMYSSQRDGSLNTSDGIKFMTTFVIPEYTVSGKDSSIQAYNMFGNPIKTQFTALTGVETGQTKTLTSTGSNTIATKTKGVKFIAKLATNNVGHFERDVFGALKNEANGLTLIYDIINKNYYKFTTVNRIIVQIVPTASSSKYSINGAELKFELTEAEANELSNATIDFIVNGLRKTPYESMYFSMLEVYKDNLNSNGSAKSAYVTKVKKFLQTLKPAQLYSILFQTIVDNNDTTNDMNFMNYEVETGVEDIIVSNNINSQASLGGTKEANTRQEINWAGNSSDYKLTLRLATNGTDLLNNSTHKLTLATNETEVKKIHQKNYTGTEKLNATTLYGEVYAARVPEAELSGLKLSDYKMVLLDELNQTSESSELKLSEYSKISALESFYKICISGSTKTELSNALDKLSTTYAKGVLMKLVSPKQYMQVSAVYSSVSNSVQIVPVAYREMDLSNMKLVDGVATNITPKAWTNITTKELSNIKSTDAELAKLDTIDWKPGTIVKYKYSYTLPSGTQTTTAKYITDNVNTIFKANLIDTSNTKNITGGIRNILFNFVLVPTLKTNGTVQNELITKYDTNTKNNWVSGYTEVGDGGNLKITETKVYTSTTKREISGTWTDEGGVRTLVISLDSLSSLLDAKGNYKEDLQIALKTNYTNDYKIPMVHKAKAQSALTITNTFYSSVRVDKNTTYDTSSGTDGNMIFNYNVNKNNTNGLVIPLTKTSVNALNGQAVEIIIPCTVPRCASDNMISGDWEKVIVRIQEGELDNAVKDIIVYEGTTANNSKIIGDNNEDGSYNSPQSLLVNNKLVNNVLIRTKVQRISGSKDRSEEKGEVNLKLYYNVGGATVEESRIVNSITTSGSTQGASHKGILRKGDIALYDTKLNSPGLGLTNLTVTAGYRNNPTSSAYDSEDINILNNTRTELWTLGVDIITVQDYYPSGTVAMVPDKKTVTDKFGFGVRATISLNVDDIEIDLAGGIPSTVRVYLLNNTTKAKTQAETISGVDGNTKNSGTGTINLHGNAPITISANFTNLQLKEGSYSVIVEVEPRANSVKETNPYKAYPQETNNRDISQFNVGIVSTGTPVQACKNPNTGNTWTVTFNWYNRENANPRSYGYSYRTEDGYTVYVCACSCNNRSGPDDYKTNKKVFNENHYMKVFIWTKANNQTRDITNSSIKVYNGDSFKVWIKTYHESNRDSLPLSPSGRSPFSNTGTSCSYGSISGCNYLRRNPDYVSNVIGPSKINYNVSGTGGYNISNKAMNGSMINKGSVNKEYTFEILPEIFVPLSNRKQTISINATSYSYDGYIYDNTHPKRQLCTSVSATIYIQAIDTVAGDEASDNNESISGDTGIE